MISFRERRAWLVGITSIVLITAGMTLAFSINRFEGLRGVYSISADLADAAGLQPGNEVRVAGVRVGQVVDVQLTPTAARVEMEIEDNIELPVESRLEVKLKTLLGQKFIDLQMPRTYLGTGDADAFLESGDVIPKSQTNIPFEIYQAAREGTDVLADIDKAALRDMLRVLGRTIGVSKEEFGRALVSLDRATGVLSKQNPKIEKLLSSAEKVTRTLANSDQDIEGILDNSADVLGVLADKRATVSSLLAATNDLAGNLGLLIRASRGSLHLATRDLNSILVLAESELETIDVILEELPISQELFGRPLKFGRFAERHVCAATTEDTCVPHGTPEDPGLPVHGTQPVPDRRSGV